MVKKHLKNAQAWLESGLRRLCGSMNPEKRLAFVVGMTAIIAICSVWMITSALYQIYWKDSPKLDFKHIENVMQPSYAPEAPSDSLLINPQIPADDGTE